MPPEEVEKTVNLVMVPLTDEIITEVGGIDNTPNFQYYVSKTIFLTLFDGKRESRILDGQVIRTGSAVRENIRIPAYRPGVIPKPDQPGFTVPNWNRLDIAFEKYENSPVVSFGKQGNSPNAKYEILYNGDTYGTINYGGMDYTVSFNEPGELPYLMITIKENLTDINYRDSREVTGLRLNEL